MNFLQRMPQSTKVLLAGLLLAGGVATWYLALFRPNQTAQQPTPTPIEVPATTAKPLEVLPLPFLVTEAPKQGEQADQGGKTATVAATRPRVTVPPNPFVPLVVETAVATPTITPPTTPTASLPTVSTRPTTNPIPTQTARVQVRQPTASLPRPTLPSSTLTNTTRPVVPTVRAQPRLAATSSKSGLPGALSLGTGALPIRLTPLDREVPPPSQPQAAEVQPALQPTDSSSSGTTLDFAKAELDAKVAQTLEPKTAAPTPKPADTVQVSNLAKFIRDQDLKLAGVVLGPTSVAIFQSKDGFVVLPVGRTLPGSDVLLKSLSAKDALLVQGSESLNLEIENP